MKTCTARQLLIALLAAAFTTTPCVVAASDALESNRRLTPQSVFSLLKDGEVVKGTNDRGVSLSVKISGPSPSEFDHESDPSNVFLMVKYGSQRGHDAIMKMKNAQILHDFEDTGVVALKVSNKNIDVVYAQLSIDPHIESFEEDTVWTEQGSLDGIVSEAVPASGNHLRSRKLEEMIPYGVKMVQADQVNIGNNRVKVCVVDTGVARGHPDLNFSRIRGLSRNSDVDDSVLQWDRDTRGHGTHITGTLAAIKGNGIGVRGVGDIELFITRGLNNGGQARQSDVIEAMGQCESNGAKIISLSLAGSSSTTAMQTKITSLYNKGYLIFAAAGNGGASKSSYPASLSNVVSVTAVTERETTWAGSNWSPNVELAAPGDLITAPSINSNGNFVYSNYSGTSMATPHVAGAAALLWSHFPTCTNTQIRYALAYTAKDKGSSGCDDYFGYGIIQAKDAYDFLAENPCRGANWGQKDSTNGQCTTIDVQPVKPFAQPTTPPTSTPSWSYINWDDSGTSWIRSWSASWVKRWSDWTGN